LMHASCALHISWYLTSLCHVLCLLVCLLL
jgi:hypothetical protein